MMPSLKDYPDNGRRLFEYCEQKDLSNAYYYDLDVLRARIETVNATLSPHFKILFSLKANSSPSVLKCLSQNSSCGADISSGLELKLACENGFNAKDIFYVGPGKSIEELTLAVEQQIGAVIVESEFELEALNCIGELYDQVVPVMARMNPSYEVRGVKMAMGGRTTQFGIGEHDIYSLLKERNKKYPHVQVVGIHSYVGTRILKADDAFWNIYQAMEFANSLKGYGLKCLKVDVGGGLGVPYYEGEDQFDFDEFGKLLSSYSNKYTESMSDSCHFYIESGRFIVGPAGIFLSKITSAKLNEMEQEVEILATPALHALSEGGILAQNKRFLAAGLNSQGWNEGKLPTKVWYRINGKRLRWSTMVLAPKLSLGEYLVFLNSGAYGPYASPVWKNLEGFPSELTGSKGNIEEVRPKMTWRDFAKDQMLFKIDL